MPTTLEEIRTSPIREDACERVEQKLLDAFNSEPLSLRELIFTLANLLLDIGGSIEQLEFRLSIDEVWKRYALNPTLGNALMAFGADILRDWIKISEEHMEKGEEQDERGIEANNKMDTGRD